MARAAVLLALAAVAAVELVLSSGLVLEAQIASAVLLVAFLAAGGARRTSPGAALAFRALALVPLVRVVGIGLPVGSRSVAVDLLLVAALLGGAAIHLAPAAGVARRRLLRVEGDRIAGLSVAAGLLAGLIVHAAGAQDLTSGPGRAPAGLASVAAIVAAVVEELIFRGVLQPALAHVLGGGAIVAAAALSGLTYASAGGPGLVVAMAVAGLVLGLLVQRTGRLEPAIAGHAGLALGAGVLWPEVLG